MHRRGLPEWSNYCQNLAKYWMVGYSAERFSDILPKVETLSIGWSKKHSWLTVAEASESVMSGEFTLGDGTVLFDIFVGEKHRDCS